MSRVSRFFWHVLLFLVDQFVLVVPTRRVTGQPEVLIVKPDKLGDFVVWLDAAREYAACFPDHTKVLVADHTWSHLAEAVGLWDEVIAVEGERFRERIGYRWKTLTRIRRRPTSVVVNASVRRTFRFADTLVRISPASCKVALSGGEVREGKNWEQRWSDRWYSRLIEGDDEVCAGELRRQLSLVKALGGANRNPALPRIDLGFNASHTTRGEIRPYVVFVLGASEAGRRWPVKAFARVGRRLLTETDYAIALCGTADEQELAHAFMEELDEFSRRLTNLTGKTGLVELCGVLARARCVLSNETGSVHLAAGLGAPVVCIAGGGDFGHLVPYPADIDTLGRPLPITVYEKMPCFGCGWHCIYKVGRGDPMPCINAVGIDAVWNRLKAALGRSCAQTGEASDSES